MIPFRDVIPSRRTPIVTVALIVLNAAVFLLVPDEVLRHAPIASFFLNDGWIRLISNLWALWLFGDNVESRLGHASHLALYGLTGAAGALVLAWAVPQLWPSVLGPGEGPGSAVAGVIGAYMLLYPGSRILMIVPRFFSIDVVEVPAVAVAGIWFAVQLFLSLDRVADPAAGGGVTLLAYAGAFGIGTGLVWLLDRWRPDRSRWEGQ
jgi:membrane associated rhomboid family serine protease